VAIKQTFVTKLLRTFHSVGECSAELSQLPDLDQTYFLCDVGLGPIAYQEYGRLLCESQPEIFSLLQSADLTTRVIYGQMDRATVDILEGLRQVGIVPVLLKGISTSYQFYSPPHLRLMGDIDILISQSEIEATLGVIERLGYLIEDNDWQKYYKNGHHHLPEARNPNSGISVEVHTDLFAPGDPFEDQAIFLRDCIDSNTIDFEYRQRKARRFTIEFQLAYTIAHWTVDTKWASNISSINDVARILRYGENEIDWATYESWIKSSPWLLSGTKALVSFLQQAGIVTIPAQLQDILGRSEDLTGPLTSKLLTWLLFTYPFNSQNIYHDEYAQSRACQLWRRLIKPNSHDILIPYSLARTRLRSIHHGHYNPLRWILVLYRHVENQLRQVRSKGQRGE
jgi:hypothetical protein